MADYTFLLCSERSGSNLITAMMGAHRDFCGPAPSHLARAIAWNLERFGDLRDDDAWARFADRMADLAEASLGAWATRPDREALKALTPRRSDALYRALYDAEAAAHGKTRLFVKENRVWDWAAYLLAAFPQASFVWMMRDPRDMALSWKKSSNHPGDVTRGAEIWRQDQAGFRGLVTRIGESRAAHVLRYEDLLDDPEGQMRTLLASLGADWDPAVLDFHQDEAVQTNAARMRNWENLAKPVLSGNQKKFLRELSETEIACIEAVCGEEMALLGYEAETGAKPADAESLKARLAGEAAEADTLAPQAGESETRKRRLAAIARINEIPVRPLFPR